MRMRPSFFVPCLWLALLAPPSLLMAGGIAWTDIPQAHWKGNVNLEVPALQRRAAAAVALPARNATPLVCVSADSVPAGLYQVRLTLRPSHVAGAIAFQSGLRAMTGNAETADFQGCFFARAQEAETRTFEMVNPRAGPLKFSLQAYTDPSAVDKTFAASALKKGGPQLGDGLGDMSGDKAAPADVELELTLSPDRAVYYLLDRAEFRPLSQSGRVVKVDVDKVRYLPGETLKGGATVADVGGKGGEGTLTVYLEHNVKDRVKAASLPVKLSGQPQRIAFDVALPKEELGYALVAEYAAANGADRNEASEYFTIASNYLRVAVSGWLGERDMGAYNEAALRAKVEKNKTNYVNMCESFAWAEEDMVGMSPATEYWFSGQTCYQMSRKGLRRLFELAHESGIAVVSYGKFVMSGYLGWKTAYDYPNDHKGQYGYPVGMWEGVDSIVLDRFRNKEFAIYGHGPNVKGNRFDPWWQAFLPINPDPTPRMSRVAAEEVIRSVNMFGWDGIRWDGQMRGGGQCGGDGQYDAAAARRTQALVRYFEEIVNTPFPRFGHGYNYLMVQQRPGYDWALEDYELDELSRNGGLLMNESIGNATDGPYDAIARNLQVEGDLCRERSVYFLGISSAMGPRDWMVEAALWSAAGARSYGCKLREHARYYTRYAQYTLDERLRRLVTPEKILSPVATTRLWWQPFVYETPLENGTRRLVVNFLNIPRQEHRTPEKGPTKYVMEPGTDPVSFTLNLPAGLRPTAVNLIDPWTLNVTEAPLKDNGFAVPAVACWLVAVVDLAVAPDAPSLASLYGPPKTFGVPRPGLKEHPPEVVLDPAKTIPELNQAMAVLSPDWTRKQAEQQAALDALSWDERNARLLQLRENGSPEKLIQTWWKGGSLPADLALKDKPPAFGTLAPHRNGRVDIYHGRGAMDDRLRLPVAFAGLARFRVHDAPLMGVLRQGPGMWLANGVGGRQYPDYDVLLFTGIPHCAIGAENSYAMVQYVKDGGAVFLTGGEYAFGKGGYNYTVLERELLPVLCVENIDTRYTETPLVIEPGPAFDELKTKLDFAAKPSFWVWNQVALKPGVKVFLKSGNRPVLVGWQVGKGRVACLLLDHRGKSEKDVTAFFDWQDWPVLVDSVIAWLAPDALKTETLPPAISGAEAGKLLSKLEGDSVGDAVATMAKVTSPTDDLPGAGLEPAETGVAIKGEALQQRLTIIRRALLAGGPAVAAALGEQLARLSTLPADTGYAILDLIRREAPPNVAELGRKCVASQDSATRSWGFQLLALSGDAGFATQVTAPPPALETDPDGRQRSLALAVVLYTQANLVDEGRRRVADWNVQEQAAKMEYTHGKAFSLEAPEVPCLDAEALFQRAAWLAYLSRYDAKTYGAQFAREWLMLAQDEDYCDRSERNLYSDHMSPAERKRADARAIDWKVLRSRFSRLRGSTQSDIEALIKNAPELAAEGFSQAHFTPEFRSCMNLLGNLDRAATAPILAKLTKAQNQDLAEFSTARASTK